MKRVGSATRYSVRAAIAVSMRHGGPKLQRAARQLGVSGRSLQRRLADMGTSYSELVAEVRLDTACQLLVDSDERICDIAMRLGFSSASSFNRTFMRLMKIQPGAYRRLQSEQSKARQSGSHRKTPASRLSPRSESLARNGKTQRH